MKCKKINISKIISIFLSFMLAIAICFIPNKKVYATSTQKGYVTVSMEKFTLGLGYVIEPVRVPIYKGDTSAIVITKLINQKYGKGSYEYTGSIKDKSGKVGQTFYLSSVKDKDYRSVNIPKYILNECGKTSGRARKDWLGEFDYTPMSGWMYCVNNSFPNYSSGQYNLKNGDVMRWQYTVWGYGADLGTSFMSSDSNTKEMINAANKDKLTEAVAKINSSKEKKAMLNNKNIKSAYDKSYKILQDMTSSQSEVNKSLNDLNKALNEYNKSNKVNLPNVEDLQANATTSTVKLSWDKIAKASGYKVYRYSSKTKSYNLISTISKNTTTSYTNTGRNSATIYYYKVRAYKSVNGKNYYSNYTNSKKVVTKPKTPSIKLTTTNSKIKVTWNKIYRASGYDVYTSTSKEGTDYKRITITNGNILTYTNTNCKKGRNYYYKVRAYRIVDGKKVYGAYSTLKYAKTK